MASTGIGHLHLELALQHPNPFRASTGGHRQGHPPAGIDRDTHPGHRQGHPPGGHQQGHPPAGIDRDTHPGIDRDTHLMSRVFGAWIAVWTCLALIPGKVGDDAAISRRTWTTGRSRAAITRGWNPVPKAVGMILVPSIRRRETRASEGTGTDPPRCFGRDMAGWVTRPRPRPARRHALEADVAVHLELALQHPPRRGPALTRTLSGTCHVGSTLPVQAHVTGTRRWLAAEPGKFQNSGEVTKAPVHAP